MNLLPLVELALTQTNTALNDTNKSLALSYANLGKNDFWSRILGENTEGRNGEDWTKILISGKDWYDTPEVASDKAGSKKLNKLYIAYTDKRYTSTNGLIYKPAKMVTPASLPYEWNYYLENQSQEVPIYYWNDNKLFIAPLPTENIQQGLKLQGFKNIPDYSLDTTECELGLPVDQQDVLIQYIIYRLYEYKQDTNRKIAEKTEYERLADEAIKNIANKVESPYFSSYPGERGSNDIDECLI